jgi:catechol 2,3-dioxygenase-like lactoylglutathione lyase family enzyme
MGSSSPIRVREIDHVVLRTRDLQRLCRFYCDVLGCTLERELPDFGLTQLRAGRSLIDLIDITLPRHQAPDAGPGRNMDHFCLRVEPFDAEAIRSHLREHGVVPGEVTRRYGAEGQGPSIYLDDPDGNLVELKGPPESDEPG